MKKIDDLVLSFHQKPFYSVNIYDFIEVNCILLFSLLISFCIIFFFFLLYK